VTAHPVAVIAIVYVAGVLWSLLKSDARPAERVVLSLCWPLGPLAFLVTVAVLLAASVIAYPLVMVPVVAVFAVLCWVLL
jgi:hypothetical protein